MSFNFLIIRFHMFLNTEKKRCSFDNCLKIIHINYYGILFLLHFKVQPLITYKYSQFVVSNPFFESKNSRGDEKKSEQVLKEERGF